MRVLMVTDYYRSVHGGIEVLVRSLGAELTARGHHVAVAAISNERFPNFELDGNVRVHRIQTTTQRVRSLYSDPERPGAPPFPDPEALFGLRRVIALERPDIVHAHDWLGRSFLPLKRSSGARFVMTLQYYTHVCAKKDLLHYGALCTGPGLAKCLRCAGSHFGTAKGTPIVLGNFAFGAAERSAVDMFLPASHATADRNGLPRSGLPFEVIHNFFSDPPGNSSVDVEPYLHRLPQEPFLLYVGDLGRFKGVDVLLRSYESLRHAPPLVLIGKVPDPSLRLPPGATLLTDWPRPAVLEAQRRSLAVLVPSLWFDPCPLVVIEAMAAGRPVVGSRLGGIPELVADGETGFVVPAGDPVALAQAIESLLANSELRIRMGDAALRRAEAFRAEAVVPRFERVYERLLARADGGSLGKRRPQPRARPR